MATETDVCNMALGRIGALRIDNFDTDTSVQAVQCRLHYDQIRDALLRSHWWRFASARAELEENAETPAFEWDHQFDLPDDFIRVKAIFDDNNSPGQDTYYSYALEGNLLLTNESSVDLRYIKQVTDPDDFDPLFIEVLVLQLAIRLTMPLTQDQGLYKNLQDELVGLMARVRTIDKQETSTLGRDRKPTWNDYRIIGSGGGRSGGL